MNMRYVVKQYNFIIKELVLIRYSNRFKGMVCYGTVFSILRQSNKFINPALFENDFSLSE